ncbi:hypothetical protein J4X65_24880 [Escherichia coli]
MTQEISEIVGGAATG